MKENEQQNIVRYEDEEAEIDLLALAAKVWKEKKFIAKIGGIAAVIGLVVAFSIPKEYSTTATLAPESANGTAGASGGMASLASLAGINLNRAGTADALNSTLYPDIVASTPFLTSLFSIQVKDSIENIDMTLYEYMLNEQSSAWWSYIIALPFKALGAVKSLFSSQEEEGRTLAAVDPFHLTYNQHQVLDALSQRVTLDLDTKTGVSTIAVLMQNPVISAQVTDSVMSFLQEYITNYRTEKARKDMVFTEKLCEDAKKDYRDAQSRYAAFVDANQNIILQSFRTEQERLQNEMNLAYNVYNQVEQQLQVAKVKVQENTPVYAVVEPATVPIRAAKPRKILILAGFIFLGCVGASAWVMMGRDILEAIKKALANQPEAEQQIKEV